MSAKPFAIGALGAAGLAFFIHALGNHDEQFGNLPLSPVNPTGGIIPPEHPITNPGSNDGTPPGNGGTPPGTGTPDPHIGTPNPPTDNTGGLGNLDTGSNPDAGGDPNPDGPTIIGVPPELLPTTPETTTPEPVSMTLLGTGLIGMGGVSLRRRYRDWKTRSDR